MPRGITPPEWEAWSLEEKRKRALAEIARLAPEDGRPVGQRIWDRDRASIFPTAQTVIDALGVPWTLLVTQAGENGGFDYREVCECGEPATQVRRFRLGGPDPTSPQDRFGRLALCDTCAAEFDEMELERIKRRGRGR